MELLRKVKIENDFENDKGEVFWDFIKSGFLLLFYIFYEVVFGSFFLFF